MIQIVGRLSLALAVAVTLVVALPAPTTAQAAKGRKAQSQRTAIKVDGNVIKGYIEEISGDDDQGRKSLTPGYEKVAEWAAAKFKEWGLSPAGDNGTFIQAVPVTGARAGFYWTAGAPALAVGARPFLARDGDVTFDMASSAGVEKTAEVVFVGYGIFAPAKGLDEYAGVDVKDRIALVLKGSPRDVPQAMGMFGITPPAPQNLEAWTAESTDEAKIQTAYDKGAAAILLYNPNPTPAPAAGAIVMLGGMMPGRREPGPSPYTRPFLVFSNIDRRVFTAIMWTDPQETQRGFAARFSRMQRDIRDKKARSMATGVKARVKGYDAVTPYSEKLGNNVTKNVLAKIDGVDPKLKNEVVVFGGHLDHIGVTDGVVFNGADDNASGSAVAMEVARLLAVNKIKPKRTIVVGLWGAEESGLIGSNHWVKTPTANVLIDKVVTYFNMDMVGLGTEIGAPGALNFPTVFDVIIRDQDPEVAAAVKPTTGGPGGSDHSFFIEKGIEALALMTSGGGGHPDYHDSGDDPAKMEPAILARTGQFVLQGVLNLANETKTPLLIADRQIQYNALRYGPPDLSPQARGGWTTQKAATPAQLMGLITERIATLKKQAQGQGGAAAGPMVRIVMGGVPGGGRLGTGVGDASAFGGNPALIEMAVNALDIGRVDVTRDDGAWFSNGVTDKGREALKVFESNGVVVNLVNPSPKLLSDVADAAARPFAVTGATIIDPVLAAKMKAKNAVFVVSCQHTDVAGCQAGLAAAKTAFGGADNVVLTMNGPAMLPPDADEAARKQQESVAKQHEDARKTLYLALIKAGWTPDELAEIGTAGGGGMGRTGPAGNLSKLMPAPLQMPR